MIKVISFCLWGKHPKYVNGLIENVKLAKLYYPDWVCWAYIHKPSVPSYIFEKLKEYDNIKIILNNNPEIKAFRNMLWRFEPINNNEVEYLISRDVDSRISPREVLAVQEWILSKKTLHVMRDHPQHYPKILGGMYGVKREGLPIKDWIEQINNYYREQGDDTNDQYFLETIYNMCKNNDDIIIHDEIKRYENKSCRSFPIPFEQNGHFVGCYIYTNGTTDESLAQVLIKWLKINIPHRISNTSITYENKLTYISGIIKKINVMHYSKLVERKKSLINELEGTLLNKFVPVEWVDNFDREDITDDMVKKSFVYNHHIVARPLTIAEIANGMAHINILENVKDITLVLEDDTIFKPNFINNLYWVLNHLPGDWEMINLGGLTYDMEFPAKTLHGATDIYFPTESIILHKPNSPVPATLSCFLINNKGSSKILNSKHIKPFSAPIDDTIYNLKNEGVNLNIYWSQPWISYEGSKTDLFSTTLERGF
jgi:GR25 family glycosyltransferase involved in LPS biosynthesis